MDLLNHIKDLALNPSPGKSHMGLKQQQQGMMPSHEENQHMAADTQSGEPQLLPDDDGYYCLQHHYY